MRIVLAVEPRSYREAIGSAIRGLRPHLEVKIVEPGVLASEVARLDPDLVVCGAPDTVVPNGRYAWVDYRPYDDWAEVCLDGRRSKLAEVQLDDLLSIVDETAELVRTRGHAGGC